MSENVNVINQNTSSSLTETQQIWYHTPTSQIFLHGCCIKCPHWANNKIMKIRCLSSNDCECRRAVVPEKAASHNIRGSLDSDTNSIYALEAMLSSSTISYSQLWQPIICDSQTASFWGWVGYQGNPYSASQLIWPGWQDGRLQLHNLAAGRLTEKEFATCIIFHWYIFMWCKYDKQDYMMSSSWTGGICLLCAILSFKKGCQSIKEFNQVNQYKTRD